MRESKVTIKIPRPLYRKIQAVVEESGFDSPTDFIVFVLRDLMGDAVPSGAPSPGPRATDAIAKKQAAESSTDFSQDELDAIRRKLQNLGYL